MKISLTLKSWHRLWWACWVISAGLGVFLGISAYGHAYAGENIAFWCTLFGAIINWYNSMTCRKNISFLDKLNQELEKPK